jgi:hypothetical protein
VLEGVLKWPMAACRDFKHPLSEFAISPATAASGRGTPDKIQVTKVYVGTSCSK